MGLIIGNKGETINKINRITGAQLYIPKLRKEDIYGNNWDKKMNPVEIRADN